jgi:hypothetical protein
VAPFSGGWVVGTYLEGDKMAVKHTVRANGFGKTKEVQLTPVKAIRFQCIECMGFQAREVTLCTDPLCSLYPYRMGKNISLRGQRKNNLKVIHQKAISG